MSTDTTITRDEIVAIDTALAEAHGVLAKAKREVAIRMEDIHRSVRDQKVKYGRSWEWRMTDEAAHAALVALVEAGEDIAWNLRIKEQSLAQYADALAARDNAVLRVRMLGERYTGWSRFFLVNNVGGHIHSSMSCSTCRPTTEFSWLPTLSGLTEAEAVAEHGAILCTVCFPSAPVEWTNGHEVAAADKKADKCEGSGTYINRDLPHRTGFYRGNWATCGSCQERVTLTSANRLRAHKPGAGK